MSLKDNLKSTLKSIYREITLKQKRQISFRSKIITMMIISNKNFSTCEKDVLKTIVNKIYKNNPKRAGVLKEMVEENIQLRLRNDITLDSLLFDIDRMLKYSPKLVFKIDTQYLELFLKCSCQDEDKSDKEKILNYLNSEKIRLSKKLHKSNR